MILQDSNANFWEVGVTNGGLLTTQSVAIGIPVTPVLLDSNSNYWSLSITTTGFLVTAQRSPTGTAVSSIGLAAPNTGVFALTVLPTGLLVTQPALAHEPPFFYVVADTNGAVWGIGVLTDGTPYTKGLTTSTSLSPTNLIQDAALFGVWQLGVHTDGSIETILSVGVPSGPLYLSDSSGQFWQIGVLDSSGTITTTPVSLFITTVIPNLIPCIPPRPAGITESQFGLTTIFHTATGSLVTVLADYSLYCCALQSFVRPEDTNVLEILDE